MTWPALPVNTALSGRFSGGSWRVYIVADEVMGKGYHPDLWKAITRAIEDLRSKQR